MKAEFGKHKRYDIQFLWKSGLFSVIPNFYFNAEGQREPISEEDWRLINQNWEHFERLGFYSGQLGTLYSTENGKNTYHPTEYKINVALAQPHDPNLKLSDILYYAHRVSAVGIAVITADGKILVQRRPEHLMAGNYLDSIAGYAEVKLNSANRTVDENGIFDFDRVMHEKIVSELYIPASQEQRAEIMEQVDELTKKEMLRLNKTALFSSGDNLSGMVSAVLEIDPSLEHLTFKAINERVLRANQERIDQGKKPRIGQLYVLKKSELSSYIIKGFTETGEFFGDSAATYLSFLPLGMFIDTVREINQKGKNIEFGTLVEGEFKRQELI